MAAHFAQIRFSLLPTASAGVLSMAALGLVLMGCGGGTASSTGTGTGPSPSPTPPPTPGPTVACTVPSTTITHTSTSTNPAHIVFLNSATYPQARCNDGSSPAYVFRPGSGAAASRWIISLQGGNDCYDNPSCTLRAAQQPQLVSSNPYQNPSPTVLNLGGIQSSDATVNPDFYDANQVLALYCSSDRWAGARMGSGTFSPGDDTTWNFEGHAIVAAVIDDLMKNHGLASAGEILFTGGSAGGVGAYVNVNAVAKHVPQTARFVASSDAGYDDLAADFDPSGSPPDYAASSNANQESKSSAGLSLWNASGDPECAASATTLTEQLGCFEASQLLGVNGTITLPMLVMEAQQDKAQLSTAGIPQADLSSANFTPAESGYIAYFAATMRTDLEATNSSVSIFSPDALIHEEQNDSTLFGTSYSFPSTTTTLQQAVHNWYEAPCKPERNIAN